MFEKFSIYTLYVCFCYTLYVCFCYTLYVYFCYTLYVYFCYTLYVYFCYALYVCFCYTLYVCFCYTLYVRNSKSLKLEKFEIGKDRSSKRSTLHFESHLPQNQISNRMLFNMFFCVQKPYTFMQGSCRRVALTGLSKTFDGPPTDGPFYKRQLIDKLTKQQQLRGRHTKTW